MHLSGSAFIYTHTCCSYILSGGGRESSLKTTGDTVNSQLTMGLLFIPLISYDSIEGLGFAGSPDPAGSQLYLRSFKKCKGRSGATYYLHY